MRHHPITRATLSIYLLLAAAVPAVAAPPAVNGRIEKIGPFRVLRVWGTPEEMGLAHGFLAGKNYLAPAKEYYADPARRDGEERLRKLVHVARIPQRDRAEIEALFKGIVAAAGKTPTIEGLDRPLGVDDLYFDNSYDLFRAFAFGCSGFTVWGEKAGDAGVLTARNFDFLSSGPRSLSEQLIIVRHPKARHAVASITWPGLVGVFTGINEYGVCAFIHDGGGKMIRTPEGEYTPLMLTLKELLETARPETAHALAEKMLEKITPYPFSYMIRIVIPRVANVDRPVRVFRIDATGLSENPVGALSCVTTNHYLAADFSPPTEAGGWSTYRYRTLTKRTQGTVTRDAAWQALRDIAEPDGFTLHSLVVLPEWREIDLAFATWEKKIVPAPTADPTTIRFDQLFASPE